MKSIKQNYHEKYFESNLNNPKNIWGGIKFIITTKNIKSTVPKTLFHDENKFSVKLLAYLTNILPLLLILQSRTLNITINTFLNT